MRFNKRLIFFTVLISCVISPKQTLGDTPRPISATSVYNPTLSITNPGTLFIPEVTPLGNQACYFDNNSTLGASVTTATELTYLHGVTSPIQAQIDAVSSGIVASVTASTPLASSGGINPNITCQIASSSQAGCLDSTDWNTFNGKQSLLTFMSPLSDISNTVSIPQATSSQNGYLSSSDWSTFNSKQSPLSLGNLTDVGTDGISVTGGTGAVIGSGTALSQHVADTIHNGYLTSADWNTFNEKQSAISGNACTSGQFAEAITSSGILSCSAISAAGSSGELQYNSSGSFAGDVITTDGSGHLANVASISLPGGDVQNQINGKQAALTFNAPLNNSANFISIPVATSSVDGYLSHIDWTTFNGKQAPLSFTSPLSGTSNTVAISQSSSSTNGYLSSSDWSTFNSKQPAGNYITALTGDVLAAGPGSSAATVAKFVNRVYVDFVSGNDSSGNGSPLKPWKTLQHTCNTITPTINVPITIYLSGGNNDTDASAITCPPNITITSDSAIQIGENFSITGGSTNDTVTINNITFVGTFTWVRNDGTEISLGLFNTGFFGAFDFEQDGAGYTATFLLASGANTSFGSGMTVRTGEIIAEGVGLISGVVDYKDSGSAYLLVTASDLYGVTFELNGGITAEFGGDIADVGYSIVGATTGSGTPIIYSDAGSIPPASSITGSYVITPYSQASHEAYLPATPGNWSPTPSTVAQALDQLAARPTGGSSRVTNTVTTSFTVPTLSSDYLINVNDTAGIATITLPSATSSSGFCIYVKDLSSNSVTISGAGGQTIDNNSSVSIFHLDSDQICANGSEWYIY